MPFEELKARQSMVWAWAPTSPSSRSPARSTRRWPFWECSFPTRQPCGLLDESLAWSGRRFVALVSHDG